MDMIERTTATEYKFKGRILNTRVDDVLLPDGSEGKREIIEHSGGVGVIALTDDNCICLVRQYRHPYGEVIYEIPAGKRETGEEPLTCGKRELSEEAGYTAEKWLSLGGIVAVTIVVAVHKRGSLLNRFLTPYYSLAVKV